MRETAPLIHMSSDQGIGYRIRQLLLGRHHRKHSEKHYHNILLLYPSSSKLYFLILPLTNGHHIKFYSKRGSRILSLERYCISAKMNFGT